ncbi:MAG: hypothetical protein GX303_05405 [Clostridiales bacterium]|nr:hypothetical protein [Clostridiales bacterium]
MGRFINADSQINIHQGLIGYNLFCYGGNNPVNTVDPTGHAFMFLTAAVGAVAGAIYGGIKAAKNGGSVIKGALIGGAVGGLVGLGAGAAAGVLLAGNAAATTAAVATGLGKLAATVSSGGIVAGATYLLDNISKAFGGNTAEVVTETAKEGMQVLYQVTSKAGAQ